jgi:uncharacterized membrane protein
MPLVELVRALQDGVLALFFNVIIVALAINIIARLI